MTERSYDGPKAIETKYKGCLFRSRLKARWAVFFDYLGIPWEYEKEGYELDGRWYLPDFWVPYQGGEAGWGFWVEIKPTELTDEESRLLDNLARVTGHRTFAICGNPWSGEHRISVFDHYHGGTPENIPKVSNGELAEIDCTHIFHKCSNYLGITKNSNIETNILVYSHDDWGLESFFEPTTRQMSGKPGRLKEAFTAARSARF